MLSAVTGIYDENDQRFDSAVREAFGKQRDDLTPRYAWGFTEGAFNAWERANELSGGELDKELYGYTPQDGILPSGSESSSREKPEGGAQ